MIARLGTVTALAAILAMTSPARSEYSPRMEPGRLAVRHASWLAADECRGQWPVDTEGSVLMHITLSRRGRALSVRVEPSGRTFSRCVLQHLRAQTFSVTGPDLEERRWVVVSRFVFPRAGPPSAEP